MNHYNQRGKLFDISLLNEHTNEDPGEDLDLSLIEEFSLLTPLEIEIISGNENE